MGKKILVADDDVNIINIMKRRLQSAGYEVTAVLDGKAAIEKAVDFNPDLIILDVMMPHLDGTEVARMLKEESRTKAIPIIYVTALKSEHEDPVGDMFQASPIFGKPFDSIELMQKIRELIER